MNTIFLFSKEMLVLMLAFIVLTLIFQLILITNEILLMPYHFIKARKLVLSTSLLLFSLLWLHYIAVIISEYSHGFFEMPFNRVILYSFFIVISILSILNINKKNIPISIFTIISIFFLMPREKLCFQNLYPAIYLVSIYFLLFRAVYEILDYREVKRLSSFSLKEAIDGMNFGLLLYKARGENLGGIMLCNNKMQDLMVTITNETYYDAVAFFNDLIKLADKENTFNDLPIFSLKDKSIWQIRNISLPKSKDYNLLFASDITNIYKATTKLCENRQELELRHDELESMMQNLEFICRQEELHLIKSRVHDILGHRVSLMIRALRSHKVPDYNALHDFACDLISELKKLPKESNYSFDHLQKDFSSLGVSLHPKGSFPKDPYLKKIIYDICLEATTNAVKHGYASDIYIEMRDSLKKFELCIINNGVTCKMPVKEGGGLKGMRIKVEELGGDFFYKALPDFTVFVSIPKGGP